MLPELEKPRITEIQVRMDCNGCVQKIKKALTGINGIYDLSIDFPQQKLTIIGWADPEKIIKAIKKTRKIATICSHTEQTSDPPQQAPTEGSPPASEATTQTDGGQPETTPAPAPAPAPDPAPAPAPAPEPPKDPPPERPQAEPSPSPSPVPTATSHPNQPAQTSEPKEIGEVHVIHHHPPDYGNLYGGYGGQWNKYHNSAGQGFQYEPPSPPIYVTHSYNTYQPSPSVTQYEYVRPSPIISEFEHLRSLENPSYYSRTDRYSEEDSNGNGVNGNINITSIFSDENPNACKIM